MKTGLLTLSLRSINLTISGAHYILFQPLTHYSLYLNKYLFKLAEIWLLFFQVTALSENRKKNFEVTCINMNCLK